MVSQINRVFFQGFFQSQKPTTKQIPHFTDAKNILSQPIRDEVSFSGTVLKIKTLKKALKKMGLELVKTGGRHSHKIVGKGKSIPVPTHSGRDIATGTAHEIAKQLGFKNVQELKDFV